MRRSIARMQSMRPLMAEGGALVVDFIRFGGCRLGMAVALMIAGGLLEGIGLAMLIPIFSLLAQQTGGGGAGSA